MARVFGVPLAVAGEPAFDFVELCAAFIEKKGKFYRIDCLQ